MSSINDTNIDLTEHELATIAGGGDPISTIGSYLAAGAAAIGSAAQTAWGAVLTQAGEMQAAGYAMTGSEAMYVATGAVSTVADAIPIAIAADAVLVTAAGVEGVSACSALSTLAGQYQSQGQSFLSSWINAIADGIAGPDEADYY